jgi:hypothetical protein
MIPRRFRSIVARGLRQALTIGSNSRPFLARYIIRHLHLATLLFLEAGDETVEAGVEDREHILIGMLAIRKLENEVVVGNSIGIEVDFDVAVFGGREWERST